jgi:hypothetical protein
LDIDVPLQDPALMREQVLGDDGADDWAHRELLATMRARLVVQDDKVLPQQFHAFGWQLDVVEPAHVLTAGPSITWPSRV